MAWRGGLKRATLPREASKYSAEMYAINMAIKIITAADTENHIIFSDSASVLKSLSDIRTTHPIARRILHDINRLHNETNKRVEFGWVPSHMGIEGNEKADRAAVTAAALPEEYIGIDYKDWYPIIKKKIQEAGSNKWKETTQKLKEVKSEATPWKIAKTLRRGVVIINRLLAGHCAATHGYLNNGRRAARHTPSPICEGTQ